MNLPNEESSTLNIEIDRRRFLAAAGAGASAGLPLFSDAFEVSAGAGAANPTHHQAMVIGIDETCNEATLKHARQNAVSVVEWLASKAGVDPRNIMLFTNPPLPKPPIAGVQMRNAKRVTIKNEVRNLPKVRENRGRLYFYFSGHGHAYKFDDRALSGEDSILPEDHDPLDDKDALSVKQLLEFLQSASFDQQFFFIDSCRNNQQTKKPTGIDDSVPRPGVRQFVLHSTPPGQIASGGGEFTKRMLAALRGTGWAKVYRPDPKTFNIDWMSLVRYLTDYFKEKPECTRLNAQGQKEPLTPIGYIIPSIMGLDWVDIASLKLTELPRAKLKLAISPPEALAKIKKLTLECDGDKNIEREKPGVNDLVFDVRALKYRLHVVAEGCYDVVDPHDIDLTNESEHTETVELRIGERPVAWWMTSQDLKMVCEDSFSRIEIVDASGAPVPDRNGRPSRGIGELLVAGLPPGLYESRVYASAHGAIAEEPFLVQDYSAYPQKSARVKMLSTPSLRSRLSGKLAHYANSYAKLLQGQWKGRGRELTTDELSPPLLMAQLVQIADYQPQAEELRTQLKIAAFEPGAQGLRVILAIEGESDEQARAFQKATEMRFAPLDGKDEALNGAESAAGLAVYSRQAAPGAYRLTIHIGEEHIVFPVCILPGRRTQLVLYRALAQPWAVTQFAMETAPAKLIDADALWRLDRLQRDLQAGQAIAPALLASLPSDSVVDPLSAAVRLYLTWTKGEKRDLETDARSLTTSAPNLPDGHVALAWALEARGLSGADEFAKALDAGLPVVSTWMRILADGARRHKLIDRRGRSEILRKSSERRIPLLLWSAWEPAP